MKHRRYSVWNSTRDGKLFRYFVSDADTKDELSFRHTVAEFPVSELYEAKEQEARATAYCAYLNRIVDAAEQAYRDNALIDILKDGIK